MLEIPQSLDKYFVLWQKSIPVRLPICLIILRSPERTKTEVVTIIHTQGDGPGPQDALWLCLHLDTPSSSNKI